MAFGCLARASFLERGVPSPTRLSPTRFAADDIQLPLARALAEEVKAVGVLAWPLADLELDCLVDETVGDMNRGTGLPRFSLESRV